MKIRYKSPTEEKEVPLPATGVFTIGRQASNSLKLNEASVSRRHALLERGSDGVWRLSDCGSQGGTYVNGARIYGSVPIHANDSFRIEGTTLTLLEDGDTAPSGGIVDWFRDAAVLCTDVMQDFKKRVQAAVLTRVNAGGSVNFAADKDLAERAEACLDQVLQEMRHEVPENISESVLREAMLNEILKYGPITPLLKHPDITEIMVNGPDSIFVESKGRLYEAKDVRFIDEQHLLQVIQRIVEPVGRYVNASSPMVDARLPEDGSRVNAIIPPLALNGPSVTIRRFPEKKLTSNDLIRFGSMTKDMSDFLEECVRARQNILVSGGTGSGKTTLLNVLSQAIPEGERLVTVEDSAELKLSHRNIVKLEARPANVEGRGRVTIRDLVVNCLRMRPDRIIVGECRNAEALDMLQAMNTGHNGSLTTVHANSPRDALARLETMVMMAGLDLPSTAIREQVASAIDFVVHQARMPDGSRKIVQISEVTGRDSDSNTITMQDIFVFKQTGIGSDGKVVGEFEKKGVIPKFLEEQRDGGTLTFDLAKIIPGASDSAGFSPQEQVTL